MKYFGNLPYSMNRTLYQGSGDFWLQGKTREKHSPFALFIFSCVRDQKQRHLNCERVNPSFNQKTSTRLFNEATDVRYGKTWC